MNRFTRGERNIEALVESRQGQRANLLAWKGSAALYRAVLAHESRKADEFQRFFQQVRDSFAEASKLQAGNDGVPAIIGGSLSLFADRLPEQARAASWAQAYDAYALLWKFQGASVDQLPVHLRGELAALARICSGAMYPNVPRTVPACVATAPPRVMSVSIGFIGLASPKSRILTWSRVIITFSGLRSRRQRLPRDRA